MFNSNIILDGEGLTFKKHFETSKEIPLINFTMAKDNFIALIKRNDYTYTIILKKPNLTYQTSKAITQVITLLLSQYLHTQMSIQRKKIKE